MNRNSCIVSALSLMALGLAAVTAQTTDAAKRQQPAAPNAPHRISGPENPAASTVADLIQDLKDLRQKKAALEKQEQELIAKIKAKLAEQKKEVQDLEDLLKKVEAPPKGNKSVQRMLRWTMAFNTKDGEDYAAQLRSLGAILAIEGPDEARKATVYRDLSAPAKGEAEDLTSMKRIWWIDDKAESVSALCRALGIKPAPKRLIVFLGPDMEQKLLRLELKYADGKGEEEIKETVFEIKKADDGKYEPVVVSQR